MSNDIEELTALNRDYVASVQNCDVKRFDEILAQDFYCSNPDKSLVDRAAFLKQTAVPVTIRNLRAEDVKIRILGDFAIIHAATRYTTADGQEGPWAVHRLLGEAEREMAGGVSACVAVGISRRPGLEPGPIRRGGMSSKEVTAGVQRQLRVDGSRHKAGMTQIVPAPGSRRDDQSLTHRT